MKILILAESASNPRSFPVNEIVHLEDTYPYQLRGEYKDAIFWQLSFGNITTEEVLRSLPHHHHLLEYTNERQDHHDDATTLSFDEGGDVDAEESYRDQEERLRDTTEDQRVLENVASYIFQ